MKQNTIQFGQEIEFGDINKGDIILTYNDCTKEVYKGEVYQVARGALSGYAFGYDAEKDTEFFVASKNQRVWRCKELRIVEVNSLRPSQKPFTIQEKIENSYLSKRATGSFPAENNDWTLFPSLAKSFSSFGEASEYLQKYLTSFCEVVFLKVC